MARERIHTEEFAARVAAPLKGELPAVPGGPAQVLAAVEERARRRRIVRMVGWVAILLAAAVFVGYWVWMRRGA
jgi:hypothetical protein